MKTLLLSVALACGVADAAVAQDVGSDARASAERHLASGRRLYRELDFPGCVDAMERALAVSGIGSAQRLEAYEYLAAAYVVLDREGEAALALDAMFRLDPYHLVREPSGSPKIARFVEERRALVVRDAALGEGVRIHADLPETARIGRPLSVRVTSECAEPPCPEIARVALRWRTDDERDWSDGELASVERGVFEGDVPARQDLGLLLLYAQARDARGRVLARAGEPLVPLRVPVREASRPPLTRRWWFWTALTVVAAGAAVGLAVGLRGTERAPSGTLPPGRVELP